MMIKEVMINPCCFLPFHVYQISFGLLKGESLLFKVTYTEKTGKYKLERQGMLHLRDFSKQVSGWSADD